jgi:hypothetical protein
MFRLARECYADMRAPWQEFCAARTMLLKAEWQLKNKQLTMLELDLELSQKYFAKFH